MQSGDEDNLEVPYTNSDIRTANQPPYSSDLAHYDFWLFPKIKENLRDNCYKDEGGYGKGPGNLHF